MNNQPGESHPSPTPRRRGFFFWIGRAIFMLLILFFGILILIQLPPIQMIGAQYFSKKISKTLDTKVTVGGFNLHPISDLSLKKVFIGSPGYENDTLLRTEELRVDFKRIWDLFSNRITITHVSIDDGFLNIEKKAGDTLTNLDVALLKLLPAKDTSRSPFVLDLEKITGSRLQVNIDDQTVGSLVKMVFPRADISLDTLDMPGQYIKAKYIDVDQPLIHVTRKITEPVIRSSVQKQDKFWSFDIAALRWTDGMFYLDDQTKPSDTSRVYGLDYSHLFLSDVDIEADSISSRGFDMRGKNAKIHILHQNGFELKTIEAKEAVVSSNGIRIDGLRMETKNSHIRNSIALDFSGYTDFQTFNDSVRLHIPNADVRLQVSDLLNLAPGLGKVSFFADNKDDAIVLSGDVDGIINRLRVLDMDASMGGLALVGDFRSRDLTKPGKQLISLDLNNSTFSASAIRDLFPKMKLPALMTKLGTIHFTGKFDGYPDDFVAYGTFNTGLGRLTMDMNLNIVDGLDKADYSGKISMDNFDVGTFMGNKDIGRVTMTGRVIEGHGLTANSLNADLEAQLISAVYKGYTYRDARLDGQITDRLFAGTMDINDPNLDVHFEGTVDFRDKKPKLDFISRIDSVRILDLGFGKTPIAISGVFDVDLEVGKPEEIIGSLEGEKVTVSINGKNYHLDTLSLYAQIDTSSGERFYSVKSDVVEGVVSGVFDPATIMYQVQQYLHEHYPSSIAAPNKVVSSEKNKRISWDLSITDSAPWFLLMGLPPVDLQNTYTHGTMDLTIEEIYGFVDLPELHYNGFNVYASSVDFHESKGRFDAELEIIAADLKENLFLEDVYVTGSGTDDSLKFRVITDHVAEVIEELDIEVFADPEDGNWTFSVNPIELDFLGASWLVPAGNKIEIRDKEFNLENFELVSEDQRIVVNDIDNVGIEAFITGFDISYLNSLWVTDKFEFAGKYTLDLEIDNIYKIQEMSTVLHIPAMTINNVPYGEWILNGHMDDPQDSVSIDLVMNNNETHLTAKGAYLLPIKAVPKEKQNYLRLDIETTEFPLDFLEFLMGGNIRDTEGSVDLSLELKGRVDQLDPNGTGKVYNGSTTIDYLGTAYSFHNQSFRITPTMIDLTGTRLYDVQGNSASVTGGLTHRHLKNLGLDAKITSPKIIGLDVTSAENSSFYGDGIGSVDATFSGTLVNPVMNIEATTAKGTHIYIPLSGGSESTEGDFVVFLENGQLPASKKATFSLGGILIDIGINVTPDALIEIIFDENTGEILRGNGSGRIDIGMNRTGNLTMRGTFTISEGDYLFTNFTIVKKPFTIEPGSQIQWLTGDPYEAELNIRAKYTNLTAPVYTLIQDELAGLNNNSDLISDARERTEVDLTMILTGQLLKPNINFDISFPELTGSIAGYANEKIRTLKANQNALMEQVVMLLVARSFTPPSTGLTAGLAINQGISNTLSEFLASSLSSYLSGLLGDIIPEGKVLSGFGVEVLLDVDLPQGGVIDNSGNIEDPNTSLLGVTLPIEFFNDRLKVALGGNFVYNATFLPQDQYFAGNVALQYDLTPDGDLKIRMYNRNDLTLQGRKNKAGIGLVLRKEYNSFSEIFKRKKKPAAPPPDSSSPSTPPPAASEPEEQIEGG